MQKSTYTCPKCGNRQYESFDIRTTGNFATKLFNIQNKKFTTVICKQCRYTEFYAASTNQMGNILDFFTN